MARERRTQKLEFEHIKLGPKERKGETLFFLSGKRLYEIADQSGNYPPLGWRRPGFLVGRRLIGEPEPDRPEIAAHLLQEMGGIWSHPIKGIENLYFSITIDGQKTLRFLESQEFENHLAYADMIFEEEGIRVERRDFVVEDQPALFALVRVKNQGEHSLNLKLNLWVTVNMIPSWFAGLRQGEDITFYADGKMVAYDTFWPSNWGMVFGTSETPESHQLGQSRGLKTCTMSYGLSLNPGEEKTFPFLFVIEHEEGYPKAIELFDKLQGRSEELLHEKIQYYHEQVFEGVRFRCSDRWFTDAFYLAKANLAMLVAEPAPYLNKYLFAGIPEYVQFFGCDTTYSIPGLMAAGFHDLAGEALHGLAKYAKDHCGRVPHEVTTNGKVFHPGNTQETPQFTIAAWEYFKWSGDRAFLEEIYPICYQGVTDYVPAHWDLDLDYYPDGNAMVERMGMGSEKLDSMCYFSKAMYCLAAMARVLGYSAEAETFQKLADDLRAAINSDWWLEEGEKIGDRDEGNLYADSLEDDHTRRMDGHWTVAVPMETGLAPWDRGNRSLDRIEREWITKWGESWGMVHTRVLEEFVWTLPTGLLAFAEFNYGRPQVAMRLLLAIAETLKHGTLGSYKELIPEGLSFYQLWSPAVFLQGAVEGVFGMETRADEDHITIFPRLPDDWKHASLEGLKIGDRQIGIFVERTGQANGGKVRVDYQAGHGKFRATVRIAAGQQPTVRSRGRKAFSSQYTELKDHFGAPTGQWVLEADFELEPGEKAQAAHRNGEVILELLEPVLAHDGSGGEHEFHHADTEGDEGE